MAIAPKDVYPGQLDETDPIGYPHGKAQNETNPGDDDGTPLEQTLVNDLLGFQQAILAEAGMTPSGTPDKADASQYLEGLKTIIGAAVLRAPLQAVGSELDSGLDTAVGSSNVLVHCIHETRIWLIVTGGFYNASFNGTHIEAGFSMGGPTDAAWNDAASDDTNVVAIGDSEAIYTAVDLGSAWAACSGGISSGSWRAIVHDGTRFVAGSSAGQFAHSTDGATFSSVVSGGANWLAGGNSPGQMSVGKGPSGATRIMAVARTGTNKQYFAWSEDHGLTWSNTAAVADLTWIAIAYRASDHRWIAIGTNMGGPTVYTSTDGGTNWTSMGNPFPGTTPTQRLSVFNEYFVTMNSNSLLYAQDPGEPWYRGARVDHGDGNHQPRSLVVGAGRLGWLLSAVETDVYLGLSQAGDQLFAPQLS